MDGKAVALGALAQTAVFALLLSTASLKASAASFVVGGVVTGWFSDSFESEFVDGTAAATLGLGLSLVSFVVYNWVVLPAIPLGYKLDDSLLTFLHGTAVVIAITPVVGIVGSVTGHASAQLQGFYGHYAA